MSRTSVISILVLILSFTVAACKNDDSWMDFESGSSGSPSSVDDQPGTAEDYSSYSWDSDIRNLAYCQIRQLDGPDVSAALGVFSNAVPNYYNGSGASIMELFGHWGFATYSYIIARTSQPVKKMCIRVQYDFGTDINIDLTQISVGTDPQIDGSWIFRNNTMEIHQCVENASELVINRYWSLPYVINGWSIPAVGPLRGYILIRSKLWVEDHPELEVSFSNENRSKEWLCNCGWDVCNRF